MMTRTVVGLFDSADHAENAVQSLIDQGVPRDNISLVARDIQSEGADEADTESSVQKTVTRGAVGGGVLGGVLGLLVGVGAIAIPGLGPLVLAGPLASALTSAATGAIAGAASGGLLGALVGAGVPEEQAGYYAEGVRRGGILVSATVDDTMADLAYTTLQQHGAVNMEERVAEWREAGWTGDTAMPGEREYGGEPRASAGAASERPASDETDIEREYGAATSGEYSADARTSATTEQYGSNVKPTTHRPHGGGETERQAPIDLSDESVSESWEKSDKVGTATGGAAGAIAGAAIGAAGGPVGAVVGGLAGAAIGGTVGAGGDIAMERSISETAERQGVETSEGEQDNTAQRRADQADTERIVSEKTGEAWEDSSKVGTASGTAAGAVGGGVLGAAAGPAGAAIGASAGAALGAGVGAAGDIAERKEDEQSDQEDDEQWSGQEKTV